MHPVEHDQLPNRQDSDARDEMLRCFTLIMQQVLYNLGAYTPSGSVSVV